MDLGIKTGCRALVALSLLLASSLGFALNDIGIVIEDDDPAPGLPAGNTLRPLSSPVINASGLVVFAASINGPGVTAANDGAIWVGKPGNLQLLVREGDPAPGTEPGTVFWNLQITSAQTITRSGEVAFKAQLTGPSVTLSNNEGFWAGTPGNLRLLGRKGDPAPGTEPGTVYSAFSGLEPSYTDGGFLLSSSIDGPYVGYDNVGLWSGQTALTLALRQGKPAPAVTAGSTVTFLYGAVISQSGELAAGARILPPSGYSYDAYNVIYIGRPNNLQVFIGDGARPPGLGASEILDAPHTASSFNINDSHQLAFTTFIRSTLTQESVWAGVSNNLRLIARTGQPFPDASGATFYAFINDVFINHGGKVVFQADTGPFNEGRSLLTGTADNLEVLVRSDLAPPDGGTRFDGFSGYVINASDQVAFFTTPHTGLYIGRPGNVRLVAALGTQFDAGAKGIRTIKSFVSSNPSSGSGNEDGRRSFLSDNGQVVFYAGSSEAGGAILISPAPPSPIECLFDWAEENYPALFAPSGPPTAIWDVYSYRHYPATNAYLGVSSADNHVYYKGADGILLDEGPLSYWLPVASCQ